MPSPATPLAVDSGDGFKDKMHRWAADKLGAQLLGPRPSPPSLEAALMQATGAAVPEPVRVEAWDGDLTAKWAQLLASRAAQAMGAQGAVAPAAAAAEQGAGAAGAAAAASGRRLVVAAGEGHREQWVELRLKDSKTRAAGAAATDAAGGGSATSLAAPSPDSSAAALPPASDAAQPAAGIQQPAAGVQQQEGARKRDGRSFPTLWVVKQHIADEEFPGWV